ncbi:hypothetical protein DKL61_12230 [Gammaproteobacteria bacterium ESL0073]|nr:hypothetical protein DKL61_12230 [Gammaproteobacteria bacterium ESL0073]
MRKTLIPLLLVALPLAAQTVYSYKDSNGNTVFTEQPPSNVNAEPVKLPSNTQNVADETTTSSQAAPQKKHPKHNSQSLRMLLLRGFLKMMAHFVLTMGHLLSLFKYNQQAHLFLATRTK